MMSVGCLISESVLYDETFTSSAYTRIVWFNSFVNGIFALEAFVKIVALGFILGDGAYLRDTFNCIDFLVIMLQFILFAVNITTNVTGARSARFVKFMRVATVRVIRIFRRFLQFNAIRGEKFRLMLLEAKAEDTPALSESIERLRVVFEPRSAETMEYNLRVLQPDVLRVAQGLIDELYQEKFDPELVAVYESQTDAVHQTVQKQISRHRVRMARFRGRTWAKARIFGHAEEHPRRRPGSRSRGHRQRNASSKVRHRRDSQHGVVHGSSRCQDGHASVQTKGCERRQVVHQHKGNHQQTIQRLPGFHAKRRPRRRLRSTSCRCTRWRIDSALARRRAENASVRIRNRSLNASAKAKIVQDDLQQKTQGAGGAPRRGG